MAIHQKPSVNTALGFHYPVKVAKLVICLSVLNGFLKMGGSIVVYWLMQLSVICQIIGPNLVRRTKRGNWEMFTKALLFNVVSLLTSVYCFPPSFELPIMIYDAYNVL